MSDVRSACEWEKGSSLPCSLTVTLQQVMLEEYPLVFALVCQGEKERDKPQMQAGYLAECMVGWFYNEVPKLCRQAKGEEIIKLEHEMKKVVNRSLKEWETYDKSQGEEGKIHMAGLLLWNKQFVAFGNLPVYVLNRRFNRPRKKNILNGGEGYQYLQGEIQGFVTFYLGNQVMYDNIEDKVLLESLYAEQPMEEGRLTKRLRELVKYGEQKVKQDGIGAIVVEVQPC